MDRYRLKEVLEQDEGRESKDLCDDAEKNLRSTRLA